MKEAGADPKEAQEYERGCILNFLSYTGSDGFMPVVIARNSVPEQLRPKNIYKENMHKPILAQHAAFLVKSENGDAEWLRNDFSKLQYHMNNYIIHHKHKPTGLFYWQTDKMIGVDNDPCTFYRPDGSSGSIYLNCLGGVRTLSPQEKMYRVAASNNPSCWLGPVWGISNYLTFRGLLEYGYLEEAKELCEKTITLLGRDIIRFGAMHEYYSPDDGEPVINRGFQNWNMLVLNMICWYEGKDNITEF